MSNLTDNPIVLNIKFPQGKFLFAFDWNSSKHTYSRNVLPCFARSHALHKCYVFVSSNDTVISRVPMNLFRSSDTFEEAMKEYNERVESSVKLRREYLLNELKYLDEVESKLKHKASKHIWR